MIWRCNNLTVGGKHSGSGCSSRLRFQIGPDVLSLQLGSPTRWSDTLARCRHVARRFRCGRTLWLCWGYF